MSYERLKRSTNCSMYTWCDQITFTILLVYICREKGRERCICTLSTSGEGSLSRHWQFKRKKMVHYLTRSIHSISFELGTLIKDYVLNPFLLRNLYQNFPGDHAPDPPESWTLSLVYSAPLVLKCTHLWCIFNLTTCCNKLPLAITQIVWEKTYLI